ncbi:MAG: glycosyltransferase family 39 protein [Candidatus Latescibacteria bacterium]|nr:glycosyltransferase family 39 protein [Candidatus Latescibacterota bacterium]
MELGGRIDAPKQRGFLVLAVAVAIGLALRLAVVQVPRCINTDGVYFVQLTEQIAAGGSWFHPTVAITPGYSALIVAIHAVLGGSFEQIACYLSVFSGALAIISAWFVWRRFFGEEAAGFSCLLLAVGPLSVQYGSGVFYEPLSLLGLITGFALWVRLEKGGSWIWGGGVGLCWGAVAWMKPEVLLWSALGGIVTARRQLRVGILLVGVTGLIYLPYILMVHEHTGKWQIATKQGVNLLVAQATGEADFGAKLEQLREAGAQGLEKGSLPGAVALVRRAAINIYLVHRYAIRESWPPILLAMVAIGMFLAWRGRLLGAWLWFPMLTALPLLVFLLETRVWYTIFVMVSGVAGLAIAQAERWRRWLLVIVSLSFLLPEALRPLYRLDADAAEHQAGIWLKANARGNISVMDRKPFVAYYAGLPQIWPPAQSGLEGLKGCLQGFESVVLVVDNRYFKSSRPEWFDALSCLPPWLREIAHFDGPEGHRVRLLLYARGEES